ncbi:hypothetical protein QJV43_gp42 [Serratia phage Serbin]|uniref:Uncharacterized protein n=1 Tax=Serratia phage Serbin TaxID=2562181 RepID=A0A482MHB7_9CAUD|nr:hypothetical protein QJV43_gp42 [Serratia phage Serbin]QBQ72958.1 hypothetical protein CPT_Serbin_042 [Serratia phage Serbin]
MINLKKLQKFVNLALNNANENEAKTAARQLMARLYREGVTFKPSLFNLSLTEATRLYDLAADEDIDHAAEETRMADKKGRTPHEKAYEKARKDVHGHNEEDLDKVTSLKDICESLNVSAQDARRVLRRKFYRPEAGWVFNIGETERVKDILKTHFKLA